MIKITCKMQRLQETQTVFVYYLF